LVGHYRSNELAKRSLNEGGNYSKGQKAKRKF